MTLAEIQPKMLSILQGIALFSTVQANILADNGLQSTVMETALTNEGITILLQKPDGHAVPDHARGAVSIYYLVAVSLRTNPKILNTAQDAAKWDVMACESAILDAVMQWGRTRNDFGFKVPDGYAPVQNYFDVGSDSRIIHFMTKVDFK